MNNRCFHLFFLIAFFPVFLSAQGFDNTGFNQRRLQINQDGMTVLGAWAIGNLAYSGVAVFKAQGQNKAFHQMNIGWGAINLALAGFSYYGTRHASTNLTLTQSIHELENTKRLFLFNAGLDMAYIATGAYLCERSKNTSPEKSANQFAGFGKSVMLQGGFLLGFDMIMFLVHQHHGQTRLYNLVSGMSFSPEGFRVAVNF